MIQLQSFNYVLRFEVSTRSWSICVRVGSSKSCDVVGVPFLNVTRALEWVFYLMTPFGKYPRTFFACAARSFCLSSSIISARRRASAFSRSRSASSASCSRLKLGWRNSRGDKVLCADLVDSEWAPRPLVYAPAASCGVFARSSVRFGRLLRIFPSFV